MAAYYENGEGVIKDMEKAFHCTQRPLTKRIRGVIMWVYAMKMVMELTNIQQAVLFYTKAAEQGDVAAQVSQQIYI